MKKFAFSQAQFITSSLSSETFPALTTIHGKPLPEIAIIGKSNVGKSSLINHLLKRKDLARVSATPGKTQTLNFFTVDNELALVDLPGYGFAKVSDDLRKQWGSAIDYYLKNRPTLKLILFLLDSRRTIAEEDFAFAKWATMRQLPLLIIFTKADKLSDNEKRLNMSKSLEMFKEDSASIRSLHYSIKDPRARVELIDMINAMIKNSD